MEWLNYRYRRHGAHPPDFPRDRARDLLDEFSWIVAEHLSEWWVIVHESVDYHQREARTRLFESYGQGKELLAEQALALRSKIPEPWEHAIRSAHHRFEELVVKASHQDRLRLSTVAAWIKNQLLPRLESVRSYLSGLPVWMLAAIALVGVWASPRIALAFRKRWKSYRRRRKRRGHNKRKLRMKEEQSEILHGRTTLLYGAAGDLRDEEYLDDDPINEGSPRGQLSGRFGTFDFFGINNSMAGPSSKRKTAPKKNNRNRNRNRSQSFDDDSNVNGFGMLGTPAPRKRTKSTDSLGNPAVVRSRSRTNSAGSIGDTVGGLYQSVVGMGRSASSLMTPATRKKDVTATATAPAQTPRLRKERLGSMDVFFAPGNTGGATPRKQDDSHPTSPANGSVFPQWDSFGTLDTERTFQQNHHLVPHSNGFRSVSAERYCDHGGDAFGSGTTGSNDETRYLYDEFGVVTLSHRVEYHGPFRPLMHCGSTMIPPISFEVVSRKIVSPEIDLPLKRVLKMDLLKGSLSVIEPSTSNNQSQNGKWDVIYEDMNAVSLKPKTPLEGGVMFLYQMGKPKDSLTWKEHTFETAHAAAQFQLDLLAYQVLGKPLKHIFDALNLVHQGSLAHNGKEYVLHDNLREAGSEGGGKEKDGDSGKAGDASGTKSVEATQCIAWDDTMRALSSIPTVRIALERLWLSHRRPKDINSSFEDKGKRKKEKGKKNGDDSSSKNKNNNSNNKEGKKPKDSKDKSEIALESETVSDAELSLVKEEYVKNRLLLGPVDFFRLFVPTLPETAIPEGDVNNRGRMEQLLCWRKRVARASVLVRSYIRARRVVNKGWNLGLALPQTGTAASLAALGDFGGEQLTQRFAYDWNEKNTLRDIGAKNEIYEASVSRDVLCHVRPFDYLLRNDEKDSRSKNDDDSVTSLSTSLEEDHSSEKHLVLSPYQAYTYVNSHYFKASDELLKEGGSLDPSRDPVDMFPSLKEIIACHPDLDFFVDCTNNPTNNVVVIHLHVRSLAKGIDPQFDNVIGRFSNASEESRKQKLYLMFQLGNSISLTFWGWLFLKILSLYFRLTDTGRDSPMNLESTRDRYGFPGVRVGGFFQTHHFGGSLQKSPFKPKNYIGVTKSIATSYQESFVGRFFLDKLQKYITKSTADVTYVIEGTQNDELPERALSTLRIVHVNPVKVAKDPRPYLSMVDHTVRKKPESRALRLRQSITIFMKSMIQLGDTGVKNNDDDDDDDDLGMTTNDSEIIPLHLRQNVADLDYHEKAIETLIYILHPVVVPCRHRIDKLDTTSSKRWEEESEATGPMVMSRIPALRMFDRADIGRYVRIADYNLKIAAEGLAETAAWRGKTFPIDKRKCRIELQSGQFFQYGFDKKNNPVFYFRNLCRGPWRGDVDAAIMALLYRLDKSLNEFCKSNSNTRVTIVVLMAHARRGAKQKKIEGDEEIVDEEIVDEDQSESDPTPTLLAVPSEAEVKVHAGNPRVSPDEKWTCHTSTDMIQKLFSLLLRHYPGRLSKVLVVKGRGKNHYYREQIQGKLMLRKCLFESGANNYKQIMDKVRFVKKTSELTQYVALNDLPTFVGGIAPIPESVYEFQ